MQYIRTMLVYWISKLQKSPFVHANDLLAQWHLCTLGGHHQELHTLANHARGRTRASSTSPRTALPARMQQTIVIWAALLSHHLLDTTLRGNVRGAARQGADRCLRMRSRI